ncbi:hypothetical protein LCGC14_0094930 [marine sediment metagenome]|uniref:Methyltransferase domain-containing protein n=1 Tax=marine sediment metagenome TaxID=412755 RepID=A0A0F9XW10_9ZZZZ|nr:class I SAM-dependent methyltransferase [Phycisphaerae bacterium]
MDDDHVRRHYEPRIGPDRPSHEIADWADVASQEARFGVLADGVDLARRSLLDVGCGTGDLVAYLMGRGVAVDYLGVDLIEKMIVEARRRHPAAAFECVDPFQPGALAGRQFDVVFASGVFNLDAGDNREDLPRRVGRLLELSREALVFNLLHARETDRYEYCFYWDPTDVRAILDRFDCNWRIIDDYLPNDFTVIGRKP